MKKIINLIAIFTALLAFSCVREEVREDNPANPSVDGEGQKVMVYFGVETPEPQTKALGENPDIQSLHVAVFGSSGYLKEYQLAEPVNDTYVSQEGVAHKQGYRVPLSLTTSKIRVHLIANGPASMDFDYESVVMAKLASTGGESAYWQRIILDHGIYADKTAEGYYDNPPSYTVDPDFDLDVDGVTHKMALIPLIRNYAKITVVALPVAESHFTVNSFAVVNVPSKGSIAPYNKTNGEFIMNYEDYPNLSDLSAIYPGNLPAGTTIDKSYPSESDFTNLTNGVVAANGAVYMYERPVPVSDATVLIVKGTYTDPDTGTNYPGYYKIDMMDGSEYLPILRNFRYQINIQKVNRKGKSTVVGAINGAGSADISADISTALQTGISDGKSSISVSSTEETLPIGGTYTLGVSFVPDVSNGEEDNSLVSIELLDPEGTAGAVIESKDDISFNASTGILTYTTTEVDPVHMKSQKIRIIGTSGTSRLYREVTIRLLPQQSMTVSCIPIIEDVVGTPQTITVSIPKDLPHSIFPLLFKVEVANKTLTPNAGDLPVEPGKTIVANQTGNSFQFIKTISYNDYTNAYHDNVSTFTCEFKSIIADSSSDVYVANPFFATGSTSFSTFTKRYFYDLNFSTAGAVSEDDPVIFTFKMDRDHETGKLIPETVDVYLIGLIPDYDNPLFDAELLQNVSGNHYVYDVPRPAPSQHSLYLLSTGETPNYSVDLSAQYYEDANKTNVPMEFKNLNFNSTVYYGTGWPTTFQFTIPDSYEMPAAGFIDIELNLTNLVPNDGNITQSGGKYYYRASSKGTKTISLKTSGSQTASVSVDLIHSDFVPATGTQTTRQYLNIAAGKITNRVSGATAPFKGNRNTVYVYTSRNGTGQVSSYTTNTDNSSTSRTNYSAANFASNIVDATTTLYLKMPSENNKYIYWASTTAETLYNNGNAVTIDFSTVTSTVTVNPTKKNYSKGASSTTTNGVVIAFSNLSNLENNRVDMTDGSTVTITAPEGYHVHSVAFSFYYNVYHYNPDSYTIQSGGGSYDGGETSGTWTTSTTPTNSVVIWMTGRTDWFRDRDVSITSISVIIEQD